MITPADSEIHAFQQIVRDYYRDHGRSLEWRETSDPYAILVSEIMLQQTQVPRVREKYREFLAAYPCFEALAQAELSELLSLWQGLGYNRRALALRQCAVAVVEQFGGKLPQDPAALRSLPGIGSYTAAAVAAFAFGTATALIETNVRSAFIHHFFQERDAVHDREILPLVERALDRENPREWYYALMDYGAMLKKSGNPSRRSRHHTRQSPFAGSNREQRSRLLKLILAAPGVSEAELVEQSGYEAGKTSRNLRQLTAEGFLKNEEGMFWIRA